MPCKGCNGFTVRDSEFKVNRLDLIVGKIVLLWVVYLEKMGEKFRNDLAEAIVLVRSPLTPLIKGGTVSF
jgi:hypothetical protein